MLSRSLHRSPILLLSLLSLIALLWVTVVRAQGSGDLDALPAWGVVPSPNGGAGPNELKGVAVLSPTDVWAVGDYGGYTSPDPAVHHWDGTSWMVVPLPDGTPAGSLLDIDALSPDDIWAVGGAQNTGDSFIFHWDGSAWSAVPHPNNATYQRLYGVSARTPDDIWAVGTKAYNGGVSVSFSLHWDGTSWSEVPTPSPNGGYSKLNSVVALAADDVWAVGDDGPDPRALHWDGSAWQVVPIPAKGGYSEYVAISAVASDDIWAIGAGNAGEITAHWDGTQWNEVPNPTPNTMGGLQDVVAIASDDVWVVGWVGTATWQTYAIHWDGSGWSVEPPPSPELQINQLLAVDADSSDNVWAVGEADGTLVTRWDGTQWASVPSANVSNATNELLDVDARAASDGWAVGHADGDGLASHWDGSSWQLVPVPDDPKGMTLEGVSMVATDDVWAVGATGTGGFLDSDPVIIRWDGSAWSRIPSPEPGGDDVDELHDVLALAADDVWAVGEYGGTGEEALILHWEGSSWTVVPNSCQYGLAGLDALSPTDVWAAGDDTLCHYDGSGWTRLNPPGSPYLRGVAALAPDNVWVVGSETFCNGQYCYSVAYSARWDGSSWQEHDVPGVALDDVHALAADDIYAVGTYSIGTTVAHWDGSGWRDVPAPDPASGGFLNGVSDNGAGGLWAVGSFYPGGSGPLRTLVLDAPSATQGAIFGDTGYGGSTVLWIGPVTGSTTSNSAFGDYAATGLPEGSYTVIATGDGCDPQQATVEVVAGAFVRQDFDLCGIQPTPVPTSTPPATTMMLEPSVVEVTQPEGQSVDYPVELHNMLGAPLVWSAYEAGASCNSPSDLPWLDVEPMAGTVPTGGMTMLMLQIDSSGMAGSYEGHLCLLDNSGQTQVLPISLTVTSAASTLYLPVVVR